MKLSKAERDLMNRYLPAILEKYGDPPPLTCAETAKKLKKVLTQRSRGVKKYFSDLNLQ